MVGDFVRTPTGLILPEHVADERRRSPALTGLDLFCGAGGFSLGAKQAGMNVVGAVEHWFEAAITYMTNLCRWGELTVHFITPDDETRFTDGLARMYRKQGLTVRDGEIVADGKIQTARPAIAGTGWIAGQPPSVPGTRHFFFGDIRQLTSERILDALGMKVGELGCVFGGPPCQGFSISGKRRADDPRNDLLLEFGRLVVELRPKTMAMENVPGIATMLTSDGVPVLDRLCRILEDGGFGDYEMFRKACEAQGAIGLLRSKPRASRPARSGGRPATDDDGHLDMLEPTEPDLFLEAAE